MMKVRNLGRKSLEEVINKLAMIAVGPDLQRQLIVVCGVAHAGVLHEVVHLAHGGIPTRIYKTVQGYVTFLPV